MRILVTGGMGYIGSHTVVELLNNAENNSAVESEDNAKQNSENTYASNQEKQMDIDRFDRLISEITAEQTDKK